MAGLKLMKNSEYMEHVLTGTFISNLNQGAGVPNYLQGHTVQNLVKPIANLSNPMYTNSSKKQSTFIADNTLAQSNYMNPRRMA
jgi:hypothetical protein